MTLTSTVKEIKETGKDFPKLMKNDHGRVVLFSCPSNGIIVVLGLNDDEADYGILSVDFDMSFYKPFTGSVTLTQE